MAVPRVSCGVARCDKRSHHTRMNHKELKELIEFLIEKDIAEFELERGDVKVKIKRAGQHSLVHMRPEAPYVAVTVPQSGAPAVAASPRIPAAPAPEPVAV